MKKEKDNSTAVIIMCLIIIVLLIICYLFASNNINVEDGKIVTNKDQKVGSKESEQKSDKLEIKTLSNAEATKIISNLFENKDVRNIIDNGHLQYCTGNDTKTYSEQELGLNYVYNGLGYRKCDNTYVDVINYIKMYFTDEYFQNNLENKKVIATKSYKESDGVEKYYYYEKDGQLYIAVTGKGGDLGKVNYNRPTYNITKIAENKIDAIVNVVWLYGDNLESSIENVKVVAEKDKDTWKISEYNVLYSYAVSDSPLNIKQK